MKFCPREQNLVITISYQTVSLLLTFGMGRRSIHSTIRIYRPILNEKSRCGINLKLSPASPLDERGSLMVPFLNFC